MSKLDIPDSWASVALDDACDLITCGVAAKPNYVASGVPFLSAKNVQNEKVFWEGFKCVSKETHQKLSKNNMPKKGDILYTRVGSFGEAAIVDRDDEFSIFVSLTLIKPKSSLILNTYLKNWLNSEAVKSLAKKSITGVGVGNLNVGAVRKFIAPLPPLGEQRRIVAKIESTRTKINEIESCIKRAEDLIEKYREALLQKAFRGELVPQDSNDESASKLLERLRKERAQKSEDKKKKKDDLPPIKSEEIPFEIPRSWVWARLGEIWQYTSGSHIPPTDYSSKEDEGIPFFTGPSDFNGNSVLVTKFSRKAKAKCLVGDILLCVKGSGAGVSAISNCEAGISRQLIAFRSKDRNLISQDYLFFLFKAVQKQFEEQSKGAAIPGFGLNHIESILIPIPPLTEQARIIQSFQKSIASIYILEETLLGTVAQASKVNSAILSKAFSGRIVSQNPAEGTGQDLLRQIKDVASVEVDPVFKSSKMKQQNKAKK